MQARVEPRFLLDTLARVQGLYDIDAQAADRILKELTAYLRVAIPRAGDSASTVATEIRLANTFLNIVGLRSRDRLLLSIDGRSIHHGARIPPMVLLPLVKHALAHRVERAQDDDWFGIDIAVRGEKLFLTIRDLGRGFAPEGPSDAEIRNIRERLAALYGERARLTLTETAGGTEAVIQIPYEAVADAMPA
jgi:LytS/YehU family sensor histidine kinase